MYALSVIVSAIILTSAAYQDWRTREIDDWHWILMCTAGSVALLVIIHDVLAFAGCLILATLMISEHLTGWKALVSALLASAMLFSTRDPHLIMIPIMYFSVYGMYWVGIINGGADAKALMSLAISFPMYPDWVSTLPDCTASVILCPCFSILLISLMIVLLWSMVAALRNMRKGYGASVSYVMRLDDARASFVWPIEDIVCGKKIRIKPSDDPEIYERLKLAGHQEVRVTPKIPFVIAIAIAFPLVMTFGNPIFVLI